MGSHSVEGGLKGTRNGQDRSRETRWETVERQNDPNQSS